MGRRRLYVEELEYILFDGYQLPPLTCIVDLKGQRIQETSMQCEPTFMKNY